MLDSTLVPYGEGCAQRAESFWLRLKVALGIHLITPNRITDRPMGDTLVIAPHPDDEVLGCGGTIARLARRGEKVTVAIVTKGTPLRGSILSVHPPR